MDRSKSILVFMNKSSIETKKYHCRVCKDWRNTDDIISGTCPFQSEKRRTCDSICWSTRDKPPVFNNIKHVPVIMKGQPCNGIQFNCYPSKCEGCVIYCAKFVLPPGTGLKR